MAFIIKYPHKMVRFFSVFALCLLVASCVGRKDAHESEATGTLFPDSAEVKWTYVAGDDRMPRPDDFLVRDSCVYLLGNAGGRWVHVYDAETGAELGSYVDRVSHVGEMNAASRLSVDPAGGDFGLFNQGILDRYMIRYSPDFKAKNLYVVNSLRTVNEMMLISTDRMIVLSPVFENGDATGRQSINLIDVTDDMKMVGIFDEVPSRIPRGLSQTLAVSPSGRKVALTTSKGGFLETFEIVGDSIRRISVNNFFPVEVSEDGIAKVDHKSRYGFNCVAASDDFIYAAFSESHTEGDPVTDVGVWDWNGNPVMKMKTDKSISYMSVTPDGKRLYCIGYAQGARFSINYIDLKKHEG